MKKGGWKKVHNHAGGGAVYGLGFIGAAIYYLQNAATFWEGLMGILKALVWPAILIHKIFELLKL